ncbi:RcpC/CpaB family pilus assembly protein [Paenarthrobacter sp. DKR-5]|uniref:Flp pilus assembly protein CpaB n=1 Tax=Paenarthrobacter sp. DKR-5 TaxID=2835535 RepID=UPI0027DC830A|nr:RcpC/CpaB family pilus assembly protein [Paenarthrobacter sp. DKR-5]
MSVYVVKTRIPAATAADKVGDYVESELMPAKAVPADAVTNLDSLKGKVASVDLVQGEQLLSSRFVDPAALTKDEGKKAVPAGMQEVTISLDPERVVGGQVAAGDTVGIVISLDSSVTGNPPGPVTHMTLQKVLVTNVQTAAAKAAPASSAKNSAAPTNAAPTGTILVTVARKAADIEKIVFGAEFGKIWLTKEPSNADTSGTRPLTRYGVFG